MVIYLVGPGTDEADDDGQAAMRAESGQRRYAPPDAPATILGAVYATPGARETLGMAEPEGSDTRAVTKACPALDALLSRLATGDDGDTSVEDRALNARAYGARQGRVLGNYAAPGGGTVWGCLGFAEPAHTWAGSGIDFAACLAATTIMLPDEY